MTPFSLLGLPKDGLPANILDNVALRWRLSKEDIGPMSQRGTSLGTSFGTNIEGLVLAYFGAPVIPSANQTRIVIRLCLFSCSHHFGD